MKNFITALFLAAFSLAANASSPLSITITNYYESTIVFGIEHGSQYVSLPRIFYLAPGKSITASVSPDQIIPICHSPDPFTTTTFVAFRDPVSTNEGYFGIGLTCVKGQLVASMNGLNGRWINIFTQNGPNAQLELLPGKPA